MHLVGFAIEIMSQHSSDFFGDIKRWLTIACSSREQNQLPDIAAEETEVNLFKQTKLNRMGIKELYVFLHLIGFSPLCTFISRSLEMCFKKGFMVLLSF